MIVDDALKSTVRHHLANWKTLRGVTPFYSKMFWPPVEINPAPTEEESENFASFPSVDIHLTHAFTDDELRRAELEYPQYSTVFVAMKNICHHFKQQTVHDTLCPTFGGSVTFDLLKAAYKQEDQASASLRSALEIAKYAIKMKEFSEVLCGEVTIKIAPENFAYKDGRIRRSLKRSDLPQVDLQKALQVVSRHALPSVTIKNGHEFSAIAADIASQGFDAVFISNLFENGHCATGLEPIKSIRAMDKHLGRTLPVKARAVIGGKLNRFSLRNVIRPFVKAEHGVRVFVVGGVIVAATAQTADAEPGRQTEPFIGEIGNILPDAHTGPYRTNFQESSVQPVLFKKIIEKAEKVATDLRKIGQMHYAMDLLIGEKGNYVIDLYDLATADYFALSPVIIANAIQAAALRDLITGVESAQLFETSELTSLWSLSMKDSIPVRYTYDARVGEEDHILKQSRRFSLVVENTATIRGLLQLNEAVEDEQWNGKEVWLAKTLAISEEKRKEFDLKGLVEAIQRDFSDRFLGNIENLRKPTAPLHLVPLLDAALWFKKGQRQTWRYCLSNECDKTVTVRSIDSAPSRSERRSHPGMGDPFTRSTSERNIDNAFGMFDDSAVSNNFMSDLVDDDSFAPEEAEIVPVENDFDFTDLLPLEDED
jgi:hypothetical protein